MQAETQVIGTCTFRDGNTRTVYLDIAGRQYVLDDGGRRIYGTWLPPETADADPMPQED